MLCHIFSNTYKQKVQWMLPLCSGKFSAVIWTHTHTASIKRALPLWVLHLVSVFSTDYDGTRVSLLTLLMWRDDTCGSWIERHKGFQIENMEWWRRVGVLFLLFILPRSIFGTHQLWHKNKTIRSLPLHPERLALSEQQVATLGLSLSVLADWF